MKVLLTTLEYPPFHGGVAEYYGNLVKHWPEPDKISVLHNNDNGLLYRFFWPRWLKAVFRLRQEIKNQMIDHVIAGQILPVGTAVYFASRLTCVPYTVMLHGMDFTYALRSGLKKNLAGRILEGADRVVCASRFTARLVADNLPAVTDKLAVVNPGVDPGSMEPTPQLDKLLGKIKNDYHLDNKLVLFSIGRLVKRKGFDMVIRAMNEAVKAVPDLYYYMAGDGPDKIKIMNMAKGVPNIVYLGPLDDDHKRAWMRACDVFITPSRRIGDDFEGFGIVFLEANLAGKPVIAGDSGGTRDAVKGAYSGILVDPEKPDRIAAAITKLAKDAALRRQLGEQGRERVVNEFGWGKKVKEFYDVIKG